MPAPLLERLSRTSRLRRPRGAWLWHLLVAILSFALPLALSPIACSDPATRWERIATYSGDAVVRQLLINPVGSASRLYAVGETSGLTFSADHGQTWYSANNGLPRGRLDELKILDLIADPDDPNVLYTVIDSPPYLPRPMVYWSADAGVSWQPRASLKAERVRALAFGPSNDALYALTANDIMRTFQFEPDALALSPQERFSRGVDDLHWLTVDSLGAQSSANALVLSDQPVKTFPAVAVVGVASPPASVAPFAESTPKAEIGPTLYVGTDQGLRVLVDEEGAHTQSVLASNDPETLYLRRQAKVYAICVHPRQPERVYVGTDRGLYTTEDGGNRWYLTAYALQSKKVFSLLIDPERGDTLYAGVMAGGVYVSEDAGATWALLGHGIQRATVWALALDPETRTLYAGTDVGLWQLSLTDFAQRAESRIVGE